MIHLRSPASLCFWLLCPWPHATSGAPCNARRSDARAAIRIKFGRPVDARQSQPGPIFLGGRISRPGLRAKLGPALTGQERFLARNGLPATLAPYIHMGNARLLRKTVSVPGPVRTPETSDHRCLLKHTHPDI